MLKKLVRDQRGNVAVIVALSLPVLVGFVALVAEYGSGLTTRAANQRTADLAAYSGALAYQATSSTDAMNAAAARVASLNGISSGVTTSLVTSPRLATAQAVSVTIDADRQLLLAPIVGSSHTLHVSTRAFAQLSAAEQPGCIIALSPSETGVTLTGGTSVSANDCSVSSNNTVSVPCGTRLTALTVNYNSAAAPSQPCTGITAPSGKTLKIVKTATPDPLAGKASVAAASGRHASVATMTSPSAPAAPTLGISGGTDINFPWWNDPNFNASKVPAGCTPSYDGGWIITCASGGTYTWGQLDVHHVKEFKLTGTSATTFNFRGNLNVDNGTVAFPAATYNFAKSLEIKSGASATFGAGNFTVVEAMVLDGNTTFGNGNVTVGQRLEVKGGRTVTFGNGNFDIRQGIITNGGSSTTFGSGTFNVGEATSWCSNGRYSICHQGTSLTFGGPSTFNIVAGIYNNGGSRLSLGSGTTNVYDIGPSSGGNALNLGGGSNTVFADSLGSNVTFKLGGHLNVVSGGGSCLTLPAAAHHDIKGNFITAGGTILGAGRYTVNGYMALGSNGGGSVTCNGTSVGIVGEGVTIAVSGTATPSSGSCSGMAFCVAAGYNAVALTAPTSGETAKILVVGPMSGGTQGAAFNEGASTSLSGVFYFPTGPLTLTGGASIANGTGQCLTLIGSRITLSGGTKAASACITSSGGSGAIVLVQ